MTHSHVTWRCACGAFEAEIAPVKGTRCICYCRDCQAFLAHLGKQEIADGQGGTDLYQTMPDQVRITRGAEHLAALKLTDKGPIRWYTTCCKTPVCNTGARRAVPLASFPVHFLDAPQAIGPVIARVNRKGARGHIEGETGSVGRVIVSFIGRALVALVTGRYRRTPFFDAEGRPVAKPKRLSHEERAAAYGS